MISIFLAKVLGSFLLIKGLVILSKKKECEEILEEFLNSKLTLMIVGVFELFFGLVIVTVHNYWFGSAALVVTIFGWLMLIEGLIISFFPQQDVRKMIKWFDKPVMYYVGAFICIILGAYLIFYSSQTGFYGGFHR